MLAKKEELIIAAHFRQNARVKLTQLARKTGVSVSTLFDRVRDPQGAGITRFCALLDFPALGFSARATLLLKAGPGKRDALRGHLLKALPVNSLMRVNNGYDFLAECVFPDMRELEEFCDRLEHEYCVRTKEVHLIVEELKRESFLSDPVLFAGEVPDAWIN
jgi:DNA-binding Lrp family transcriptional regulator